MELSIQTLFRAQRQSDRMAPLHEGRQFAARLLFIGAVGVNRDRALNGDGRDQSSQKAPLPLGRCYRPVDSARESMLLKGTIRNSWRRLLEGRMASASRYFATVRRAMLMPCLSSNSTIFWSE